MGFIFARRAVAASVAQSGDDDWALRVAHFGTERAVNFDAETDTTAAEHQTSTLTPANIVWDQSDSISGGGSLKLLHPGDVGQNAGNEWLVNFFSDFRSTVADEAIYAQYALKIPQSRIDFTSGDGFKVHIMAAPGSTFQGAEFTCQNINNRGYPQHYTNAGSDQIATANFPTSSVYRRQTAWDNGWTISDPALRYALSNGAYGAGTDGALDFSDIVGVWTHFLNRVIRRSDGTADVDVWVHRRGIDDGWRPLQSDRGAAFNINQSFRSLHLLSYTTNGSASGIDTHQSYDEVITSSKMPPPPQSQDAPSWFTAAAPLTWTAVGESMNSAAHPDGPPVGADAGSTRMCFEPWTGPVMDTERGELIFAANQGHGDGDWNGVISLTFKEDTPTWRVPSLPSTNRGEPFADAQMTDDNAALSSHSYDCQAWCPATQQFFFPWRGSITGSGGRREVLMTWARYSAGSTPYVRGWDTLSYGGAFSMDWSGGTSDWSSYGCADYDPVTEKVLTVPAWANPLTNSGVCAIDPVQQTKVYSGKGNRNPVVSSGYPTFRCGGSKGVAAMLYPNGRLKVWDTAELDYGDHGMKVSTVLSGGPTLDQAPDMVWHEPSEAFLVRGGTGRDIYKLRPTDWSQWTTAAQWGFTAVTCSGATPDAHYAQGSHGKFRIIPNMGNGEAALVLIPKETSTPLFMRLSGAV